MNKQTSFIAATVILAAAASVAQSKEHPLLTQECEEALALSALPANLRASSSAYTLTADGFELTKRGDGPFTCIVARNHPTSLIPQCPDAEGVDTVLKGIIKKTEWALDGLSAEESGAKFDALAQAGELVAPERPGISYMMSPFNLIWNAGRESIMRVPPHVMFYAPHLSNDDIGGSMQLGMGSNRGYPFLIEEGIHGYVTTLVEKAADPEAVFEACRGQVAAIDELEAAHRAAGD